jgi:hypothetical protein
MANTSGSVYLCSQDPPLPSVACHVLYYSPVVVAPITVVSTATGAIAGIQPLFSPYFL